MKIKITTPDRDIELPNGISDLEAATRKLEGHNSNKKLIEDVERIERLNQNIAVLKHDIKNVFEGLKQNGHDIKAVKAAMRLLKISKEDRESKAAMVEIYMDALGDFVNTPLGGAIFDNTHAGR